MGVPICSDLAPTIAQLMGVLIWPADLAPIDGCPDLAPNLASPPIDGCPDLTR